MRKKPFFQQNYSKSFALMHNYLFHHVYFHLDMFCSFKMRPAKTLLKTSALSPDLSNHSRSLHLRLFIKFLPPSLEETGEAKCWHIWASIMNECGSFDRERQMAGSKSTGLVYRGHNFKLRIWVLWLVFWSVENSLFENDLQALIDVSVCAAQSGPWRIQVPIGLFTFITEITGWVEPSLWWCQYCLMFCIMDLPEGEW